MRRITIIEGDPALLACSLFSIYNGLDFFLINCHRFFTNYIGSHLHTFFHKVVVSIIIGRYYECFRFCLTHHLIKISVGRTISFDHLTSNFQPPRVMVAKSYKLYIFRIFLYQTASPHSGSSVAKPN